MCGIIRLSASSKKRLNYTRICVVPVSLYSKHGDMLPSQFNVSLKTIFKCFDFATSGQRFLMQATSLSPRGAHS